MITIPILLYLSSFLVINGELSLQNSVTTEKCKYSDVKQELDAVRQLLNQETLIRMSLERTLKDLTKEVEEWKKTNDCVNKTITLDYKSNYDTRTSTNGTPTYVRWGKSTCSNGSTLVYAGQAGGTMYNAKGGAANPLCLTFDVLWGNRKKPSEFANLHGAKELLLSIKNRYTHTHDSWKKSVSTGVDRRVSRISIIRESLQWHITWVLHVRGRQPRADYGRRDKK
ncbi:uncharacterized protein LOC134273376 [Saccostrea cucullata]|uniref:uncharacterized protein LOC134273376 n=1 Tax=Saccostrea cuccullata TaxID=36930 RepID=UPI002ECFF05A